MKFKEWLFLESGDNDGSDWFYGNSLLPTDAFDWADSQGQPAEMSLLQSRWQKERDQWGRKFHNLDVDGALRQKFTSVYSNTMPEAGDGFWRHSTKERPNLKVDTDAKFKVLSIKKQGDVTSVLTGSNPQIDNTEKLNHLFGEFKPSSYDLPTNFDEPWSPYSGTTKMKYRKKRKGHGIINNL